MLLLPERLVGGTGGDLLGALVAGGAFAAFLSTASGLTMAVAGVLTQDVLPSRGVRHFRLATPLAILVPLLGALLVSGLPVADAVGMAFAVSASSFCPLLVLGIWWRGLTPPGAAAGLLLGGGSALLAVAATVLGAAPPGPARTLLAWPAVWSVPVGFLAMAGVSLATPGRIPAGTNAAMARFHLPEALVRRGVQPVTLAALLFLGPLLAAAGFLLGRRSRAPRPHQRRRHPRRARHLRDAAHRLARRATAACRAHRGGRPKVGPPACARCSAPTRSASPTATPSSPGTARGSSTTAPTSWTR